ncbi:MAG: hypothetical protein NZ518_12030 [Dehalococcoidia bacterium]|nr:hypothetical protein [Dehalococcoidia bacterium]
MIAMCHFCDQQHPFDATGVAACRPKNRFRGVFDGALKLGATSHEAGCSCDHCVTVRAQFVGGRLNFLGEPPDPGYVWLLTQRISRDGWPPKA